MSFIDSTKAIQPHLEEMRRALHRHPETSWNEKRTSELILKELQEIGGWDIRTGIEGSNGIFAELTGAQDGPAVALRADMDALSIAEETGLPFSSEEPGVMHACGHDNHMTMLLGAARLLKEYQGELKGKVRLIFQPAEELAPNGGSRTMIRGGALEGIDHIFGLHVWPNLPTGVLGVRDGAMMASSDHYFIHIEGSSSHGAQPHQGVDALVCGAQFMSAVQSVISRNLDPLKSAVITIGIFKAGSRYNIIPGTCDMEGTCRTYDPEVRRMCEKRLGEILDGICAAYGCKGTLKYEYGYNAVVNHPEDAAYMRRTMEKLFGEESVTVPEDPAMTAEDYSFYLVNTPGAFGWLGTTPEGGEVWPLHSCRYAPDEAMLWKGAALLAELALDIDTF